VTKYSTSTCTETVTSPATHFEYSTVYNTYTTTETSVATAPGKLCLYNPLSCVVLTRVCAGTTSTRYETLPPSTITTTYYQPASTAWSYKTITSDFVSTVT
jgi:hypothetical protein